MYEYLFIYYFYYILLKIFSVVKSFLHKNTVIVMTVFSRVNVIP